METLFAQIADFFDAWGWWIAVASVAMFVISLVAMPYIVARIPVDYFTHSGRHRMSQHSRHPIIELLLIILKNLLGAILLIAGVIMLFTPGQGLLSILFGLMIMNYPGKYRLECWIIRKPLIFGAVNAMREKQGEAPLAEPESDS